MSQGAALAGTLSGRMASISGEVLDSFPGQKGQLESINSSVSTLTVLEKSVGRLPRSVAIITHSPVIGSCRSSDILVTFLVWSDPLLVEEPGQWFRGKYLPHKYLQILNRLPAVYCAEKYENVDDNMEIGVQNHLDE